MPHRIRRVVVPAMIAAVALAAACAPTVDQARSRPPLWRIRVSALADRLLPCLQRLLADRWAARGVQAARAAAPEGVDGAVAIADRDGPLLLVDAVTLDPHASAVFIRALRLSVAGADVERVATLAEACSS
jgi:hypothetical protein